MLTTQGVDSEQVPLCQNSALHQGTLWIQVLPGLGPLSLLFLGGRSNMIEPRRPTLSLQERADKGRGVVNLREGRAMQLSSYLFTKFTSTN